MNDEAPYRDAHHAVHRAYMDESRDVVQVSRFLANLRGGVVKDAGVDLSPWEWAAQSAMTIRFIRDTLTDDQSLVIEAKHTVPEGDSLWARKEMSVTLVGEMFYLEMEKRIPKWWAVDSLREWAWGSQRARHHTDKWWAQSLGRSERTLKRWRIGMDKQAGLDDWIAGRYASAMHILESEMFSAGITRT